MNPKSIVVSCVLAAGLLITSGGAALAAPSPGGTRPHAGAITAATWRPTTEECAFLALINAYRAKSKLPALTISLTLGAAAEDHSLDMADNDYFSHTLSDGTSWSTNLTSHGYPTGTMRAENIAAGSTTASGVFDQWKNSPGHNANMLGGNFRAIGIARVNNPNSTFIWYWTTTFGSKVDKSYTC